MTAVTILEVEAEMRWGYAQINIYSVCQSDLHESTSTPKSDVVGGYLAPPVSLARESASRDCIRRVSVLSLWARTGRYKFISMSILDMSTFKFSYVFLQAQQSGAKQKHDMSTNYKH